jgi:hypothetical protein
MLGLVLLLSLWTAWLLFSLTVLGRAAGIVLAALFLALWALLVFTTSLSWRNYLMIWLCVPAAIALWQVLAGERSGLRSRLAVAAVSAAGVLWLWLAGGAAHAPYVLTAVLGVLAAALFSAAGFGLCWVYFYLPAQRAQQSAEHRRNAAERSAAEADRRTMRVNLALDEAQRTCHNLQAENAKLRTQRSASPLPRRRPYLPYQPYEPYPPDVLRPLRVADVPGVRGAQPQPSAATIALIRVTCYALREEPAGRDPADPGPAQPATRFLIKRETVVTTSAAAPPAEALRHDYEQAGAGRERESIRAAAADYAAQQIQGTVLVSLWQTQESFPVATAADFLDGSAGWLRGLVTDPLSGLVSGVGLPGPVASAGAGIGANFVTAPVTTPLEQAARVCEVAGIVFGVLTGLHPVVIACAKRLARDETGQALSAGFQRIMTFPDAVARPAAAAGRDQLEPRADLGRTTRRAEELERRRQDALRLSRELRRGRDDPSTGPAQGPGFRPGR